ncbi:hypothetical protein MKEN_01230500 [Mycena kentingensis (nom. inval.)]|nr:hypothetical protein MKEN_01230500 [Mycena kentingensis (nom. inval.)]
MVLLRLTLAFLLGSVYAAPSISVISNTVLDNQGVYFVSFDGVVNSNSFQESAAIAFGNFQYAAWYTSSRAAVLARRTLPSGAWSTLQLPHNLFTNDSHNVISLGISPLDGVIHVAMDCHSTQMFYTKSEAGLATSGASWVASRFGAITTTLGNLNVGTTVTYPQFVVTPTNLLQFVYRSGVSGNGATQLAEYSGGTWSNVGSWASATGTYTAPSGATSTLRNLYIHGFTYHGSRAYVTGTWREQSQAVYDRGRTWHNAAGTSIGTSGSNPVNVNTAGIIVDSLNADHALMNQESQTVDSAGLIHAIISYVPGRFTQCVPNYETGRPEWGHAFHLYQAANGSFVKVEIPFFIQSVGRSQIVMDAQDNLYVIMPFLRIVTASKASGWTDWTSAFNGTTVGLNVFNEVTVDRSRVSSGVVSVMYQVAIVVETKNLRVTHLMASQLRSLIGLQVLSRLFTFLLNQSLLTLASPGAYGTAAIQFELISSTILFLSREGVRNALLRVKPSKDGAWHVANGVLFLPLMLGIPLALATSVGYARFASTETQAQAGFRAGITLYALAAVLELWAEPMHNRGMAEMKTHVRFRAEGSGVMARTFVTFLVLLYDARRQGGELALVAFAVGQLSYALCVLGVYLAHYGVVALTQGASDDTLRVSLTMTSQSIVKHFLTEGDKFILGWFSPLQDQGGYAVAVNYGSLIARIVFQPIEETSRISFSKTLSPPIHAPALKSASNALISLVSAQTSFSLLLLVFGPAYLPVVLPIVLPRQYLSTSAPRVLHAWIWYIPVLALNGGLEAFISSVSTPRDLNRQSWWMAVFSVIYISAAIQLYSWNFGDTALVYANIINLTARIAYAAHFTTAFFSAHNARSVLRWRRAMPGWRFASACLFAWGAIKESERRMDMVGAVASTGSGLGVLRSRNVVLHVGVGGVLGCGCLLVWWISEGRALVRQWRRHKLE